jgi:hypothetical protein
MPAPTTEEQTPQVTPAEESNVVGKNGDQNPPSSTPPSEDAPKPKVVSISEDELEARVQREAAARIEAEKEAARLAEAEAQGNYKQLYENEKAERRKVELAAWRSEALAKHSLADEWFDSLSGETKDDIMKSAKAIKKRIDEAIAAQQEALLDSSIPSGPGNKRPPREKKPDGKEITRRNMAAAFNISNLPRIH